MNVSPASQAEISGMSFEMDELRLRFRDPQAERIFERETLHQSLDVIRLYLAAGTLLYASFGILDVIVCRQEIITLFAIRYGFVCSVLIGVLVLTYTSYFERVGQFALAATMIASGSGIIAMTAVMPAPYNAQYYAGLIMVVIWCSSLIRLRFYYSNIIAVAVVCAYEIVATMINPIPRDTFVSNNFFLFMATAVGLFSGYYQELYVRKSYFSQKVIEAKNAALNALLVDADNANRSKSEFLGTMSHELRTPLNAIIGFSDILRNQLYGKLGNEKYLEYVGDINASGLHLLAIINDILDLAKAEAGRLDLREDVFDAEACLQDCAQMCGAKAEEGGVALVVEAADPDIQIQADERLLRQLVLNLVSNAVKFTPPGGRVNIGLRTEGGGDILIEVADDGIGIPPEHLERVLRPFEQVERALSRRYGGTGLGLPFAKKIAELHGGSLTLQSAIDSGTQVTVRLPAYRLVPHPQELARRQAV